MKSDNQQQRHPLIKMKLPTRFLNGLSKQQQRHPLIKKPATYKYSPTDSLFQKILVIWNIQCRLAQLIAVISMGMHKHRT